MIAEEINRIITEELNGMIKADQPKSANTEKRETQEAEPAEIKPGYTALYLYCIAEGGQNISCTGIDGEPVFTVRSAGYGAVVHACPESPYSSTDAETVSRWVREHQQVIDAAEAEYGTVIPSGFDTIIRPDGDRTAEKALSSWIEENTTELSQKISAIAGRHEYSIQIFVDPASYEVVAADQPTEDAETPGLRYLLEKKSDLNRKREMSRQMAASAHHHLSSLNPYCDEIKVLKPKADGSGERMLLNLSCLVDDARYEELCSALDHLERENDLRVRFTGPWPAYSFV